MIYCRYAGPLLIAECPRMITLPLWHGKLGNADFSEDHKIWETLPSKTFSPFTEGYKVVFSKNKMEKEKNVRKMHWTDFMNVSVSCRWSVPLYFSVYLSSTGEQGVERKWGPWKIKQLTPVFPSAIYPEDCKTEEKLEFLLCNYWSQNWEKY